MLGNEQMGEVRGLRELQREMYLMLGSKLLEYASQEYLSLCSVLRHEPRLSPGSFLPLNQDYPIIGKVYNMIARSYEQRLAELESIELVKYSHSDLELRRQAWRSYFQKEAQRLSTIPSFTDRLLQAVIETDPAVSAELQSEILRFLQLEYP